MRRRLLLVGGAPITELGLVLAETGFEVETAPDGFYATTLLERSRPAAVVTAAELPDMEPVELAEILAGDPMLAGVRRVLVTAPGAPPPDAAVAALFDLVLPPGTPRQSAALLAIALAAGSPAVAAGAPVEAASLTGTLGAVDFPQLVQMLAASRLAGALHLGLAPEASVYFDRGEVIHCAWGRLHGWSAFREVLRAALAGDAPFQYWRLGLAEAFRVPRTLGAPVQELLLDAAIELDQTEPSGPSAHRGPTGA
jgi:CheY-like chemotaxis protein